MQGGGFGRRTAGGWRAGGWMALKPMFNVTAGAWRFPSFLGLLLPAVGIQYVDGLGASIHVSLQLPLSILPHRHFALELTPALWFVKGAGDGGIKLAPVFSLGAYFP